MTVRLSFPQMPPVTVVEQAGAWVESVEYNHEIVGPVVTLSSVGFAYVRPGSSVVVGLGLEAAYSSVLPDFIGLLGRARRARYAKDALDAANVPYGAGRANLTACALAAASMSAPFAAMLRALWHGARAEVATLLEQDGTLQRDGRRSKFVADMLGLGVRAPRSAACGAL